MPSSFKASQALFTRPRGMALTACARPSTAANCWACMSTGPWNQADVDQGMLLPMARAASDLASPSKGVDATALGRAPPHTSTMQEVTMGDTQGGHGEDPVSHGPREPRVRGLRPQIDQAAAAQARLLQQVEEETVDEMLGEHGGRAPATPGEEGTQSIPEAEEPSGLPPRQAHADRQRPWMRRWSCLRRPRRSPTRRGCGTGPSSRLMVWPAVFRRARTLT